MVTKLKKINIALILAVFPLSALLARDYLMYAHSPAKIPAIASIGAKPPLETALQEYARIVESSVFPSTAAKLTQIELVEAGSELKQGVDLPSVLSEVKLIGTFAGGSAGFAVFEKTSGGNQEVFKTGETVFDAGTLKKVGTEDAVISVGAKEVTFTILKKDPLGIQMNHDTDSSETPVSGHSKKITENEWLIDRKAVLNSLDNMGQILTDARLTPRMSKGVIGGFMVTEIKQKSIFDSIGLKNGDILTRINGYDINSPEKAIQVLSGLKGETSVDLDIVRSGQKLSFHYQIR